MNFNLSEEHVLFRETLKGYFAQNYDLTFRNEIAHTAPFNASKKWQEISDLGVLYAFASEEAGGLGGQGEDIALVFEEVGRALCPEPFLGCLTSVFLLSEAGRDIEAFVAGQQKICFAFQEDAVDLDINKTSVNANFNGSQYLLNGTKRHVYGGQTADAILVLGKLEDELRVFLIEGKDLKRNSYGLVDGGGACDVILEETPAEILVNVSSEDILNAIDRGILALSAETLGTCEAMYELLLDYIKEREQFGTLLGRFQAIQHRMVDMKMEIEQLRSSVIRAANSIGTLNQTFDVSASKALAGKTARHLSREGTQLHGGVGMTWEYPSSHYAKRLAMIDLQFGDAEYHRHKIARFLRDDNN